MKLYMADIADEVDYSEDPMGHISIFPAGWFIEDLSTSDSFWVSLGFGSVEIGEPVSGVLSGSGQLPLARMEMDTFIPSAHQCRGKEGLVTVGGLGCLDGILEMSGAIIGVTDGSMGIGMDSGAGCSNPPVSFELVYFRFCSSLVCTAFVLVYF